MDREFKEVQRNLTELPEPGIIELVRDGRSKRPLAQYDQNEIHYSLISDEPSTEQTGA